MQKLYRALIVAAVVMAAIAIVLTGGGFGADQDGEEAEPAGERPAEVAVAEPAAPGPDPDPFMKYVRARVEERPIVLEFYARN